MMYPLKYTKKPLVVEAIQFNGTNHKQIELWSKGAVLSAKPRIVNYGALKIKTSRGTIEAKIFDWILKDPDGEFYACNRTAFHKSYDDLSSMVHFCDYLNGETH